MKPKIRIISADFGTSNPINKNIPEQSNTDFEFEYFVYTDDNYYSRLNSLHPRLKGKIPKMLDWMENSADFYVWMDSYYTINTDNFSEIVKYVQNQEICFGKHKDRNSITSETDFILKGMKNGREQYLVSRYEGEPIGKQLENYLKDETFVDNNLFSLGFFVYSKSLVKNRQHNLMTDWFLHNCYWSIQDQISLPYLLHKHKINYNIFNFEPIGKNPFAKYERY
jgi:hypothetical protein